MLHCYIKFNVNVMLVRWLPDFGIMAGPFYFLETEIAIFRKEVELERIRGYMLLSIPVKCQVKKKNLLSLKCLIYSWHICFALCLFSVIDFVLL